MSTSGNILETPGPERVAREIMPDQAGPKLVSDALNQTQWQVRWRDKASARMGALLKGSMSRTLQLRTAWDPEEFAEQQILSLIQKVFFPGWPRPARQVVFSTVDGVEAGSICARIAVAMADRVPGTVCAIEVNPLEPSLARALTGQPRVERSLPNAVPDAQQIQDNLWLLPPEAFFAGTKPSAAWLRERLSQLRREFDYVVIHASAVGTCSETALLGQLADGVILVLDEQKTRRAAARQAKEILHSANARLLGVVLSEREFPIPEAIYRSL
jgi:hypothetical protein